MDTSIRLHALRYDNLKAYLFATLFILGNLLLPQLCHLIPLGGKVLLPIFFFTLIAAYKYGLYVGLLTALFSPLVNHWLFNMPTGIMLPVIIAKSVLLAIAAAYAAKKFNKISVFVLIAVVLSYQIVGTLAEWLIVKDFSFALNDFRLALPGMLIQVAGGYLVLKAMHKL